MSLIIKSSLGNMNLYYIISYMYVHINKTPTYSFNHMGWWKYCGWVWGVITHQIQAKTAWDLTIAISKIRVTNIAFFSLFFFFIYFGRGRSIAFAFGCKWKGSEDWPLFNCRRWIGNPPTFSCLFSL